MCVRTFVSLFWNINLTNEVYHGTVNTWEAKTTAPSYTHRCEEKRDMTQSIKTEKGLFRKAFEGGENDVAQRT